MSLCATSLEALTFLVWRHLEHYLLYSGAASQAGQHTPIQQAYSQHVNYQAEQGYTPGSRAGFGTVDLERLKKEVVGVMNETFFDKLTDNVTTVEQVVNSKAASSGFLQAVLRRTKRLSTLHTQ